MVKTALNIFLIIGFVAVVCFIAYKILMFLMDKMCALIKKSKWFRVLVGFCSSILCATVGILKLEDYYSGKETAKVLFIVIVFLITSIILFYYTYLAYKDKREEIE